MMKWITSLGALFVCGFLSATSVGGDIPLQSLTAVDALDGDVRIESSMDDDTVALAISNEEAARREKICEELWKNCKSMCNNWKLKGKKLEDCRDTCRANFDDCIDDIH